MYENIFGIKKKKVVYQWELKITKDWTIDELRNRIWMATQCGQSIPGNVSVEALRMELLIRGETPNGYHENIEDVDVKNIEIEDSRPLPRKRAR